MLAVVGSALPVAMRTFLLTLAVVDDLIAIAIIAFVYTDDLSPLHLLLALVPLGIYAFLVQKFPDFFMQHHWAAWVILLPIGVVTWLFVLEAGIHATIAGVLLGFVVPVKKVAPPSSTGSVRSPTAWPSPCSRSSPPAWPWAAGTVWSGPCRIPWRSASSWAWCSAS